MLTGSGHWELIKAPDPAKNQELKPLQSFSDSPGAPYGKNQAEKSTAVIIKKKKKRKKLSIFFPTYLNK